MTGICAEEAGVIGHSNLRYSNWEVWDYYNYCWAREMTTLHKADLAIRELYYYDKFINTNAYDFKLWDRKDVVDDMMFAQKKAKKNNDPPEFIGYPMLYRCSRNTWRNEKLRCLHKQVVNWRISPKQIIDI